MCCRVSRVLGSGGKLFGHISSYFYTILLLSTSHPVRWEHLVNLSQGVFLTYHRLRVDPKPLDYLCGLTFMPEQNSPCFGIFGIYIG